MNILLLSCKTGGGHDAAANALKEQFEMLGHTAFVFDYLTLAGEKVAKRVANAYVKTVQKAPSIFGIVYKLGMFISKKTRKSPIYRINKKMSKYLEEYLNENHYDAIIMTHLYPAETLTYMKRQKIKIPYTYGVLTDYTLTPFWEETDCDEYIIPHSSLIEECVKRGLDESKLHPFGIPFSPRIVLPINQQDAKISLSLDVNKKTILLIGGSMGAGKMVKLAKSFNQSSDLSKLQIIMICGNNKKVYDKLNKKYCNNSAFKIFGHSNKIPMFMKAADIIYTKPGGLTSTEAAASRTPIVLTYPIPGCETSNKEFFTDLNMAVSSNNSKGLVKVGLELLKDSKNNESMINSQKLNINENATSNIVKYIINDIDYKNK